jgi:hypothetical protein
MPDSSNTLSQLEKLAQRDNASSPVCKHCRVSNCSTHQSTYKRTLASHLPTLLVHRELASWPAYSTLALRDSIVLLPVHSVLQCTMPHYNSAISVGLGYCRQTLRVAYGTISYQTDRCELEVCCTEVQ